jgi:hypothetical protein
MTLFHINQDSLWLTPGITERLIELHALSGADAMTMREIADKLSFEFELEVGRNAVIGRVYRLGLPMRDTVPFRKRKSGPKPKRIYVRVGAPIEPACAKVPVGQTGLTILQLRDGVCKFPLGEALQRPPYLYCGEVAEEGCSYCGEHYARTHSVPKVRWA